MLRELSIRWAAEAWSPARSSPGYPPVSLFVLQSSGSQFPARKAEQREPRPTPPPEPPPRPPTPGPGALAQEPPSLQPTCSGEAPQLGSPELPTPHYEPGTEQWVELVGVLPPHLLLPQQKVVLEPLPGLPARASPDQRVRIQRVPQVLVFGTAATALKVGPRHTGGGQGAGGGGIRRPRPAPGPLGPGHPTSTSQSGEPPLTLSPKPVPGPRLCPYRRVEAGKGGESEPRP